MLTAVQHSIHFFVNFNIFKWLYHYRSQDASLDGKNPIIDRFQDRFQPIKFINQLAVSSPCETQPCNKTEEEDLIRRSKQTSLILELIKRFQTWSVNYYAFLGVFGSEKGVGGWGVGKREITPLDRWSEICAAPKGMVFEPLMSQKA